MELIQQKNESNKNELDNMEEMNDDLIHDFKEKILIEYKKRIMEEN